MNIKRWAYGLVRPVVRPVMERLRDYFTGRLHDEISDLRREIAAVRETVEQRGIEGDGRVVDVMAQALATLALDREG